MVLRGGAAEGRRRGAPRRGAAEGRPVGGWPLGGWPLGPELFAELETEDFAAPPGYSTVEQTVLGGTPLWLRAENDFDLAQATALASIVATSGPGA